MAGSLFTPVPATTRCRDWSYRLSSPLSSSIVTMATYTDSDASTTSEEGDESEMGKRSAELRADGT